MNCMRRYLLFMAAACLIAVAGCGEQDPDDADGNTASAKGNPSERSGHPGDRIVKTETEWKQCLTPEQYRILREKGTEPPFTGKYVNTDTEGVYLCAACGAALFTSDAKFHSGSGWPSFIRPMESEAVEEREDLSHGMVRTEIVCGRCGGHLGHVFEDGPEPTGLRYCVNSASLKLEPADKAGDKPAEKD